MTRKVLVNGRPVMLETKSDGNFQADGTKGTYSLTETEQGVYSVIVEGRSWTVTTDGDGLLVNGVRYTTSIVDPRAAQRTTPLTSASGVRTLTAAMPGKVVRVLAAEGDMVEVGQGIVVVEAMKMQNEVKAPVAGKVLRIGVVEGGAVAAGALLAVIE